MRSPKAPRPLWQAKKWENSIKGDKRAVARSPNQWSTDLSCKTEDIHACSEQWSEKCGNLFWLFVNFTDFEILAWALLGCKVNSLQAKTETKHFSRPHTQPHSCPHPISYSTHSKTITWSQVLYFHLSVTFQEKSCSLYSQTWKRQNE